MTDHYVWRPTFPTIAPWRIKGGLSRKGRPIPENDVWIAAIALQHGLVLVSRDSHFEHVEGLQKL